MKFNILYYNIEYIHHFWGTVIVNNVKSYISKLQLHVNVPLYTQLTLQCIHLGDSTPKIDG